MATTIAERYTNLMVSRGQSFSAIASNMETKQATAKSAKATRIILLSILFSALASGQAFRVDPTPAFTTNGNTPPGSYPAVLAIPGATIILANYPAPTPAIAYADYTGTTQCPAGSPVVVSGGSQCSSITGPQGQFGFWLAAGNYQYTITLPNGSKTYGPFPLSVGGGGSVSLPATTNLLAGDGAGGAVDSGLAGSSVVTLTGTQALTGKTVDGVSPTVFGFLPNIASDVQAQLNGKQPLTPHGLGASFSSSSAGQTTYFSVPYSCTIQGWTITVDAGTATVDVWKIASGTAIPTISNTITASATPAIASGTVLHSTTLTGWTTSVSANDIFGINLRAVSGASQVSLIVQCQ